MKANGSLKAFSMTTVPGITINSYNPVCIPNQQF